MSEPVEGMVNQIVERCLVKLKNASDERFFQGKLKASDAHRVLRVDKKGRVSIAWIGPADMSEADLRDFKPQLIDKGDERYIGKVFGVSLLMLKRILN